MLRLQNYGLPTAAGLANMGLAVLGTLVLAGPAGAQWVTRGVSLFEGWYAQSSTVPVGVADGAGGVVVFDKIANVSDGAGVGEIAASHVSIEGIRDWAPCPTCLPPVSFMTYLASPPYLTRWLLAATMGDSGDYFAVWNDGRGGIYAQKALPTGATLWGAAGGTPVYPMASPSASVCSDFAGGAYIGVLEYGFGQSKPTVTRVSAGGTVAFGFPVAAVAPGYDYPTSEIRVVSGLGGLCCVFWLDSQGIKHQFISSTGNRDLGNAGILDSAAGFNPTELQVASVSPLVAYVSWSDTRSGVWTIYVQCVDSAGDPVWTPGGVNVGTGFHSSLAVDPLSGNLLIGWIEPDSRIASVAALNPAGTFVMGPVPVGSADEICVAVDSRGGVLFATTFGGSSLGVGAVNADGSLRFSAHQQGGSYSNPFLVTDNGDGATATWRDGAAGSTYAARFLADGSNAALYPDLNGVADVAGDEGGVVALHVGAPPADYRAWNDTETLYGYNVWRLELSPTAASIAPTTAFDRAVPKAAVERGKDLLARLEAGDVRLGSEEAVALGMPAGTWMSIGFHASLHGPETYLFMAPTHTDSTDFGPAPDTFLVTSHTISGLVTASLPMSGSSVDNLAPPAPVGLAAQLNGGTVELTWAPVTAADLAGYGVYRGDASDFAPSSVNRLALPTIAAFADPQFDPTAWYKVSARDRHGNESPFSTLAPQQVSTVDGTGMHVSFLGPLNPNPGSGPGTIAYGLSTPGRVSLSVYDLRGRRVRQLIDADEAAGRHQASWDGRDEAGHALASGTYILRLEGPLLNMARKIVRVR